MSQGHGQGDGNHSCQVPDQGVSARDKVSSSHVPKQESKHHKHRKAAESDSDGGSSPPRGRPRKKGKSRRSRRESTSGDSGSES